MIPATMSILGLYRYDDSIFDTLETPFDDNADLINAILLECAELEILYPDSDFMKWAIGAWSKVENVTWKKIYATESLEYNPIENYDRFEEISDTFQGSEKDTGGGDTTTQGSSTVNRQVFAFDDNISQPQYIDQLHPNENTNNTYNSDRNTNNTNTRVAHIHGNIGVTTAQQMIEAERDLAKSTTIKYIIGEFKKRFCILVY